MEKKDLWKKYEFVELFEDLEKAKNRLANFCCGYSADFSSAEEFYLALEEEIYELRNDNFPNFHRIILWFAPTSVWDDFVNTDDEDLANTIYERAKKWNDNMIKPTADLKPKSKSFFSKIGKFLSKNKDF